MQAALLIALIYTVELIVTAITGKRSQTLKLPCIHLQNYRFVVNLDLHVAFNFQSTYPGNHDANRDAIG